jgi:hypothetical protein
MNARRSFSITTTLVAAVTLAASVAGAEEAPWMPEDLGGAEAETPGFESIDAMAFQSVTAVGVDSFHWYRNDAIGGDTFEIDSMTTNVAAPFQLAVQVEGSWDFTVHSATAIRVYSPGSGSSSVSAGTLTLTDGYHIIFNDTAAGGSELHIDVPGPSASSSGASCSGGASCGGSSAPMGDPAPVWDEIEAEFAFVEWGMTDGRLHYRFTGNNAASTLYADLHQASGTGEIDVVWYGDASSSTLTLPAEFEPDMVSVSSGHHYFDAGSAGDDPWSLDISWGPHFCDEDLNRDGTVDFHDLLQLLYAWGPCS